VFSFKTRTISIVDIMLRAMFEPSFYHYANASELVNQPCISTDL